MPTPVQLHQIFLLFPVLFTCLVIFDWFVLVDSLNYICRRIPRLNEQQISICESNADILPVLRAGIQLAIKQCERLFASHQTVHHAWNCSGWITNSSNRLYVDITHPEIAGTKESSFAHALISAGVTYALSEACSRGNFSFCMCTKDSSEQEYDILPGRHRNVQYRRKRREATAWKWKGCAGNLESGAEMARQFLDSQELLVMTPYSFANLHNNFVGRLAVKEEFTTRCQCHGYSGSCSVRTCWRTANEFPHTAQNLYKRYATAKQVSFAWLFDLYHGKFDRHETTLSHRRTKSIASERVRKRIPLLSPKELFRQLQQQQISRATQLEQNEPNTMRHRENNIDGKNNLVYVKASVDFCQLAKKGDPLRCQVGSMGADGDSNGPILTNTCNAVCCGRGYRLKTELVKQACDCDFNFCCSLNCRKQCLSNVTVYECL